MQLYTSMGSPYGRIVRVVVREKGLEDRVTEIVPEVRTPGSPYYALNPSGRVPFLVPEDGPPLEGSGLICAYLDALAGPALFGLPDGPGRWEALRWEEQARSLMDGLCVWLRELRRPETERSPTILAHEIDRSARMVAMWEREADTALLTGPLNMVQITLASALLLEARIEAFTWRDDHPRLARWIAPLEARASFAATRP